MATKVYLPTDSKNLYIEADGEQIILTPSSQCRIKVYDGNLITVWDSLSDYAVVDRVIFTDLKNEGGSNIGGSFEDALLYLAKIIG